MKKRFIRLFMFATVIVGMGAVSSCKDYDEERVDELSQKVSTLKLDLQGQIDALEARVGALETAFATFKSCECTPSTPGITSAEVATMINQALAGLPACTTPAEVSTMISTALAGLPASTTPAEVSTMISTALAGIPASGLTTEEVAQMIADALAGIQQNPCGCEIKTAQDVTNIVNAAIANFVTKEELQAAKDELNNAIEAAKQELEAALANKADKSTVEALQATVDQLTQDVAQALGKAEAAKVLAESTKVLAESNEARITALEQFKQEVEPLIPQLAEQLAQVTATATAAKTLAEANKILIEATQATLDELKAKDQELANDIEAINEKIEDMATKEDIAGTLGYALELFNKAIALSDKGDEALQKEIDQVESELNDLKDKVLENTNAIAQLNEDLQNALKRATGIVLQGTNNPEFGSFLMPFGIQSNLLVAIKGENTHGAFVFPNPSFIDDSEAESFLGGQTLMDEEEGNAGTLYVTINPAEVDFSGTELSLENSLGEASPIKLGALKLSDKKLAFGLTRAAATGFYECPATLNPADFDEVKLNVNEQSIKDMLKDEKALAKALIAKVKGDATSGTTTTIEDLFNVTKTTLDAFKLDALAARGTWNDELGEHSILSQFGIAATAVSPLNFTSLDALSSYTSFPGFDKLANAFDRIYDKVANAIKNSLSDLNVSGISINHITLSADGTYVVDLTLAGLTDVPVTGTITGTTLIPEQTVRDGSGTIIGTIDAFEAPVNGTANATAHFTGQSIDITNIIQDIFSDANASFDDINDMLDDINDMLTSIDDMTTNIDTKLDNGKTQITNWMSKINTYLTKGLNNLPKLAKPALVVVSDNGAALAGLRGHRPTCAGTIKLIPTTYSFELIAPVFKKVVTVNGEKQTINADGTIDATNIQAGENEIKYAALDYAGNEIDMTYYIDVE